MSTSLPHALRSLKRTPVFTAAAILTLVLGIGSLAATFAIVYGVLLAPLPYGTPIAWSASDSACKPLSYDT